MNFLSPSVLYFFIFLKWGQSICMCYRRIPLRISGFPLRGYTPNSKTENSIMDTDIPLDIIKQIYEEEEERYVPC
jgi:hypothetical protein